MLKQRYDYLFGPVSFILGVIKEGLQGDEPLTVVQPITDAKALIVTTAQEFSLADVRKSINFCREVNIEILGLVENMSGLTSWFLILIGQDMDREAIASVFGGVKNRFKRN